MIQSKKWQVPFYVLMSALSLTMIFPFLWMVSTSFKFDTQVFTVPVEWIPDPVNLSNYTQVWVEEPFLLYYKNTVVVAVFATAGQVIISAMAAYAFSSIEFRGKNILFSLYLATMMVPWHTIMIPQYQIISRLGLTDTHAALILGQLASAFGIFLLRQFFLTVPRELMEAARIDGAGEGYIFSRVMLPLAKPALSTLIIFTFVQVWNDYTAPLIYLNTKEKYTIQLGLTFFQSEHTMQYTVIMAGTVCALIPIIITYLIFEKQITNGMVHSGLKG
ncbi:carbohydrate ABC transporter permease [Hungatella hathewayi]|uniref:carbohydrate ABC transporter permease n=1 Tax=Hungatella hathewayi TaxID=154046 RepID=UPI002A835469|nr:carbohydrate ABC transporter permease [Hungatella hathewayi]